MKRRWRNSQNPHDIENCNKTIRLCHFVPFTVPFISFFPSPCSITRGRDIPMLQLSTQELYVRPNCSYFFWPVTTEQMWYKCHYLWSLITINDPVNYSGVPVCTNQDSENSSVCCTWHWGFLRHMFSHYNRKPRVLYCYVLIERNPPTLTPVVVSLSCFFMCGMAACGSYEHSLSSHIWIL